MNAKKILRSLEDLQQEIREMIIGIGITQAAKITGFSVPMMSLFVSGKRKIHLYKLVEVYEKLKGEMK